MLNTNFATPDASNVQSQPLKAKPLRVNEVKLRIQPHGSLEVVFQQKIAGVIQSCQLNMQAHLVHGWVHLLKQTLVKADWEIPTLNPDISAEPSNKLPVDLTGYKH